MADQKPTADDKLIARTNLASYRLGALHAKDLLDDKTLSRLFEAVAALDAVQSAQSKLHYSAAGSENEALEKRLDNPIRQLRQSFVRKMDAACRKVDKSKLTERQRKILQF